MRGGKDLFTAAREAVRPNPEDGHDRADIFPVPEITIETLRRSLGACLDEVRLSGQQRIVMRRGHPVAALVTVTEARALWTLDHESAVYSEWRMRERLDTLARRRDAVTRQAEAERRAAFERGVLGR